MKSSMVLACALSLPGIAFASDHGPVFSYETPVNSQGEVSCDAGIFGRSGSKGSQLSTGTGCGYGITPHITANVFLPATFGSGSLPENRIYPGSEWSAGASWRFLHSVTSVGKRIESTASLGVVVPGPQQDSGVLAGLHRAPGIAALSLPVWLPGVSTSGWVEAIPALPKHRRAVGPTRFRGVASMAADLRSSAEVTTSGTIGASQS